MLSQVTDYLKQNNFLFPSELKAVQIEILHKSKEILQNALMWDTCILVSSIYNLLGKLPVEFSKLVNTKQRR